MFLALTALSIAFFVTYVFALSRSLVAAVVTGSASIAALNAAMYASAAGIQADSLGVMWGVVYAGIAILGAIALIVTLRMAW